MFPRRHAHHAFEILPEKQLRGGIRLVAGLTDSRVPQNSFLTTTTAPVLKFSVCRFSYKSSDETFLSEDRKSFIGVR